MKITPREKEWNRLLKQEKAFLEKGTHKKDSRLNQLLEDKIPEKLQGTLDAAFAKAFETIFEKGTGIIEKTYRKDELERQFKINAYAVELKEDKKSLRKFSQKNRYRQHQKPVALQCRRRRLGRAGHRSSRYPPLRWRSPQEHL